MEVFLFLTFKKNEVLRINILKEIKFMSTIYHFFGNLFNNYAVFTLVLIILAQFVTFLLNKVIKKQNIEKAERDKKYKEFEKEANGNKDELTEKIYNYYLESHFNPYKVFFLRFLIFFSNLLVVFVIIGCFSPLSNFSNIPKKDVNEIVSIYTQNVDVKRYPEISMLSNIDETEKIFTENGISKEYIDEIKIIKEKFKLFGLDTTLVPKMANVDGLIILPIIVCSLIIIKFLITILTQIKYTKDKKKLMTNLAINIPTSLMSIGISVALAVYTPVIVCIYLIIIHTKSLLQILLSTFNKKQEKGVVPA